MKRIVITGGTGLIGQAIHQHLQALGYEVRLLTRGETNTKAHHYHWNPITKDIDLRAFESCYAIINLAGKKILTRWTPKNRVALRESRIVSTQYLVDTLRQHELVPPHFIQASAIGYYGNRGSAELTEEDVAGDSFMAKLCQDWEKAASPLQDLTNFSILRIGLYLHPNGGVYKTISRLAKLYIATSFGWSPIYTNTTHYNELNNWIACLLNGDLTSGIYNAVSKNAISMKALIQAIAVQHHRRVILPPIPAFVLKIGMGQLSETLLHSTHVQSSHMPENLYLFDNLKQCLSSLSS